MNDIDLLFLRTRIQFVELILLKTKKDKEIYIVYLEKFKEEIKINAPVNADSVSLIGLVTALQDDLIKRLQEQ